MFVVGNFNPAILNPKWVIEHVFREADTPTQIQILGGVGAGPGMGLGGIFSPRFSMKGIAWVPSPNRLEVFAETDQADAGDFVVRVLNLLPHTPVQAVGNNFTFSGEDLGQVARLARAPLLDRLPPEDRALGFQSNIKFTRAEGVVITGYFDSDSPSEYRLNFHRAVKAAKPEGITAAKSWRPDQDEALRLIEHIRSLNADVRS